MSSLVRSRCLMVAVVLVALVGCPLAHAAKKLKGVYSGSGGISVEVHRVVILEFAADGSAILEQNWVGKEPQDWNGRWIQDGKVVKVTFDAVKDKATPDPLVLKIDRDTLVPTAWDAVALGPLGPPKLAPFGGKNIQTNSVGYLPEVKYGESDDELYYVGLAALSPGGCRNQRAPESENESLKG